MCQATRILNVVFDLGGVVLSWDPDAVIAGVFSDPGDRARVRAQLVDHADWHELDRGALDRDTAIERAADRTGLPAAAIGRLMQRVPSSFTPVDATIDLMRRLKARGHRVYCLSNMHAATMAHLERHATFWSVFEGVAISCHLKMVKPEPPIYRHLLETYCLAPEQTLFIDDLHVNVATAAAMGIHTIRFKSASDCERRLRDDFGLL